MQFAIFLLSAFAVLCVARSPPMKTEWPELVAKTGEEAKAQILKERPDLKEVVILPENSAVTADYNLYRVRIFVNEKGIVAYTPRIG